MTNANIRAEQRNNIANWHSRGLFYFGMALMIASIFARNILDISIPIIVVLAIGALTALVSTREEMIALTIACIPMSAGFQYKYLIFICIVIYAFKFYKDIKFNSAILPLLFMMAWDLLHGIFYPFAISEFLRGFAELIFCAFLMMILPKKKIDYKLISRLLAISSIFMMLIVLLNLLEQTNYNFEEIFVGTYRFGVGDADVKNYGVNYNANALGLIANLSIAGLLQLIVAKKHKFFDYLLIVVLVMFGVMTMSRSFLICLALIVAMFAVSGASTLKEKLKRLFLIALVIVLLVTMVLTLMPNVYETFAARFEVDDVTNGRSDLFAFYMDHLMSAPEHFLFGVGRQGYGDIIADMYTGALVGGDAEMNVCHNGTQELLVCWGLPGLVLLVWFIFELIRKKPQGLKREITNYIPLVLLLIYVQAGQLITAGIPLLALSFAYVSLCYDFSGGKNGKNS